jgi:hypothetical protein
LEDLPGNLEVAPAGRGDHEQPKGRVFEHRLQRAAGLDAGIAFGRMVRVALHHSSQFQPLN